MEPRTTREEGLAARLTAERLRRGWTQAQAAERIGVSLPTYQLWELGRHEPRGKLVRASVERFLGGR